MESQKLLVRHNNNNKNKKHYHHHHQASQALLVDFNLLKVPIPQIISQIARSLSSPSSSSSKDDDSGTDRRMDVPKPRILYIDDEVNITRVIKYGLEQYGFVVDVFNHPKLALSSFHPGVYDLLLIDVRLPEVDGLDLCNELLKIDNKVKVCFITAYELLQEEIQNKVSNLERRCIIKKPVSFDTLVSKLDDQLGRARNRKNDY